MKRLPHWLFCLAPLVLSLMGCTTLRTYVANGFKVGPKYETPPAPVAKDWIDADDKRIRKDDDDHNKWWAVFNDPVLDQLICVSYKQNLTLRQAGYRILAAKAQLGIAIGEMFPQTQQMSGDYNRIARSIRVANAQYIPKRWYGQWDFGFNLAWEIDFWGRFRSAVASAGANLEASVFDYDDVLVTLLGEVATTYVQVRVTEKRIKYATDNVALQRKAVKVIQDRLAVGVAQQIDVDQAMSLLYQTEAGIPVLETSLRMYTNQLCILLGIPTEELLQKLGGGGIPKAPVDVAVGIPADLLRRRPDIRRAERQAASQAALIGVADSDFYPHLSLIGTVSYSAEEFKNMLSPKAITASMGPSFQWNILNYGRILSNVRYQDATFQQLVAAYQATVLNAHQEAENGLITFLKAQQQAKVQAKSVDHADKAAKIMLAKYELGTVNISQLILIMQNLVQQQDTLAVAEGQIPTGLIMVYKAMGGGWQLRERDCDPCVGPLRFDPCPACGPPEPTQSKQPAEKLPAPELLPPVP